MPRLIVLSLCMFVAACDKNPTATHATPAGKIDPSSLAFVGKVWLSADFASPKGTIRIFLPDGTLVMDSCFETYRLSQWLPRAADEIVWREETAPIEARVEQRGPKDLTLKIKVPHGERDEEYIAASVPFVCPDMPR